MLPDGAVGEQLVTFGDDFAERRKVEGIDDLKASGELPAEKESDDANDAEPIGKRRAAALPSPVGGQRIGLVDGNQLEGFLFLFGRGALLTKESEAECMRGRRTCQARCALQVHGEFQISNFKTRTPSEI